MRTKKALLNLIFSLLLQFVTAISGFIQPILFINTYGSKVNGLVFSIKNLISYLNLVEAGVATAASQALYKPLAQKNINKINSILSATKDFYFKSGNIFTIMSILIACIYPFVIHDNISKIQIFLMVLIVAVNGVAEYYLIGKYRVLVTADQKSYVISVVQIISIVITTGTTIVMILENVNVLIVLITTSMISISRIFLLFIYIKRYYPGINFSSLPDKISINKKWDAFIHQIANMVVFNSPILIITIFCDLSDVSVYSVYLMVFTVITSIVTAFSNGLVAGFGEVIAVKETEIIQKSFRLFEYVYYIITLLIYTVASLMIIPFIELYTKGIQDAPYSQPMVAFLFILVFLINNLRVPGLTIIYAAGHFKETRNSAIIEALIALITSLTCVQIWGLKGALIGSCCAAIYRIVDIIIYCNKKIINRSVLHSLKIIGFNILLSLIIYTLIITFYISNPLNWFNWIIDSLIISTFSMIVLVAGNYLFDRTTFKELTHRIKILFS
ncbi:polysaccharide transport protein [Paenibacillus sp. FSL L8-0436]|uniref:lipopolysaccharide biosynthesis protein n=1 Tax=Paenibacillus sp. FSL L8-0436 TaxID=2954686 RepID=UPI0031595E1A